MSEAKGSVNKYRRVVLVLVVLAAIVYLIAQNISVFGYVLLALVGFGMVVLVHEFGHFVVAKLSGIKVEAFSIFMPPTFLGIQRTERGLRFRILPRFFRKEDDESGDGTLSFTVGRAGKPWETEYRVGLILFGGYVKMLGQEDVGSTEAGDDPRSYANKPVGIRIPVIAAGVIFNAISAILAFVIVFLVGINLAPPVIGGIVPDSPAARAGLRPGDEIIQIADKEGGLDFSDIKMAAALSGRQEPVKLRVRHEDGSERDYAIVAEKLPGTSMKGFGIVRPMSLRIADVSDPNKLYEKIGLLPADRVTAVNGAEVQAHWELAQTVRKALEPSVTVLAQRAAKGGQRVRVRSTIPLGLGVAEGQVKSEADLSHIYSMVPRLRITQVLGRPASLKEQVVAPISRIVAKVGIIKEAAESGQVPMPGDVILAIGDVENPTYADMNDVADEYEGRELLMKVLRADANGLESVVTVPVKPERRPGSEHAKIGIRIALDAEHPVVAKTIEAEGGPARLEIPRGAMITAVDGVEVSNFYDIIREIRKNKGQRVTIDYRLNSEVAGDVALNVGPGAEFVAVKSDFAEFVPFEFMERLYKASGPIDAIGMGYRKTLVFIAHAYMTLKRFVGGLVSAKEFMGPVGIVTLSYRIVAEKPLVYYVYFLGLISAFIGVLNSVPMLPFDGGHILFLLVEKIKGSPVSERVQGAVAYAGWVAVGGFALYVTFNDIVRSFFS